MTGVLATSVTKLRREDGGNIIIEGGPRIRYEFIRRNQADDFWVLDIPVMFGRGPRYWTLVRSQTNLKLRS